MLIHGWKKPRNTPDGSSPLFQLPDRLVVDFIPQSEQRYDTVGDYQEVEVDGKRQVNFQITRLSDPIYSLAALIHEQLEKFRCMEAGITDAMVDEWDMGGGKELEDPGLSPLAPYHRQHMEADAIERQVIASTGRLWSEYEAAIEEVFSDDSDVTGVGGGEHE